MSAELCDLAAEEAVLGSLLHDDVDLADVEGIGPEDFSAAARGELFRALVEMRRRGDVVALDTVGDELERLGELKRIGGAIALTRLIDRVPSGAGVGAHARIVRELAQRRHFVEQGQRIARQAADRTTPVERLRLELPAIEPRGGFPALRNVGELRADPGAEVCYLVDGLIEARSVVLVAGDPKSGKSTLIFGLIGALERGETFLGRPTKQAFAVVLSEEPTSTILQKCVRFGITQAAFWTRRDLKHCRDFAAAVAHLVQKAKAIGADVLIVDTFARWGGLVGDGEQSAGETMRVMTPLLEASESLSVLVIHHAKKHTHDDGVAAVRGSSAIAGDADTVWCVRKVDRTSEHVREIVISSRLEDSPPSLLVELQGDRFVELASKADARDLDTRTAILDALAHAPDGLSRDDLLDRVGRQRQRVLRVVDTLVSDGAIDRAGKGIAGDPMRFTIGNGPDERAPFSGSRLRSGPTPEGGGGNGGTDPSGASVPVLGNGPERRNGPSRIHCGGEDDR